MKMVLIEKEKRVVPPTFARQRESAQRWFPPAFVLESIPAGPPLWPIL